MHKLCNQRIGRQLARCGFYGRLVVGCCEPCRDELRLVGPYAYMFPSIQRSSPSLVTKNRLLCPLDGLNTLLKTPFFELFLELCALNGVARWVNGSRLRTPLVDMIYGGSTKHGRISSNNSRSVIETLPVSSELKTCSQNGFTSCLIRDVPACALVHSLLCKECRMQSSSASARCYTINAFEKPI